MTPGLEELRRAFTFLELAGFQKTGRLPLVAARQWVPEWEVEAWKRFRRGLCNVHEVAFPKMFTKLISRSTWQLFRALTLGRVAATYAAKGDLKALYQGGESPGVPRWTLVHRFGRFIVRSHPDGSGDDWVYFGDDTLFLMERARSMLERFGEGEVRCLDLCCGGGGVGLALPPFRGQLHGFDLNPVAVELAAATAGAQGLETYSYECCDISQGLRGTFDLIFGNPPTLSPELTGKDVFFATGDETVLFETLESVFLSLTPRGRAVLTFFSEVVDGRDRQWESLAKVLQRRRGVKCRARREYPIGTGRRLRHSVLEIDMASKQDTSFQTLNHQGVTLPGVSWRKL